MSFLSEKWLFFFDAREISAVRTYLLWGGQPGAFGLHGSRSCQITQRLCGLGVRLFLLGTPTGQPFSDIGSFDMYSEMFQYSIPRSRISFNLASHHPEPNYEPPVQISVSPQKPKLTKKNIPTRGR